MSTLRFIGLLLWAVGTPVAAIVVIIGCHWDIEWVKDFGIILYVLSLVVLALLAADVFLA